MSLIINKLGEDARAGNEFMNAIEDKVQKVSDVTNGNQQIL